MPVTTISYGIDAADCPAVAYATNQPSLATPVPEYLGKLTSGMLAAALSGKFNLNGVALELAFAHGGGAHSIIAGVGNSLAISDPGTGLTATVGTGMANIVGPVSITVATNAALTNNSENYIWLLQAGTLSVQVGTVTAPSNRSCYLGRVTTSGGVITAIDRSGVLMLRGGTITRRTGDEGFPLDIPGEGIALFTRTQNGNFLWNGEGHVPFLNDGTYALQFNSADNSMYHPVVF